MCKHCARDPVLQVEPRLRRAACAPLHLRASPSRPPREFCCRFLARVSRSPAGAFWVTSKRRHQRSLPFPSPGSFQASGSLPCSVVALSETSTWTWVFSRLARSRDAGPSPSLVPCCPCPFLCAHLPLSPADTCSDPAWLVFPARFLLPCAQPLQDEGLIYLSRRTTGP